MPLPNSVTVVTVNGTIEHPQTGAGASGTVTFTMPTALRTNDGFVIGPVPAFAAQVINGAFTIQLPATDDPDVVPEGWAYAVSVRTDAYTDDFSAVLPSSPNPTTFAAMVPLARPTPVQSWVPLNELGAANGVAQLDAAKTLVLSQLLKAPVNLTDAPTITTDASLGLHFRVTLGGNRTMANPSNPTDAQRVLWEVHQPASGGPFTLALGSQFDLGGQTALWSTGPSKVDYMGAVYRAAAAKWDVIAPPAGQGGF